MAEGEEMEICYMLLTMTYQRRPPSRLYGSHCACLTCQSEATFGLASEFRRRAVANSIAGLTWFTRTKTGREMYLDSRTL